MTSKLGDVGILLLTTLVLIGCGDQGRSRNDDTSNSKVKLLTYGEAIEVVRREFGEPPDTVLIGEKHGKIIIAALFAKKGSPFIQELQVLEEAGGGWIAIFAEKPKGCFFIDWQWEEIAGSPFLYYVTDEAGNQTGIAYFSLVSLDDGRKYEISIKGETRNYSHIGEIGDRLKRNPKLLTFLKYKIEASDIVSHPQPEDFDLNRPQNASKRWTIDNDVSKSEMYSSNGQPYSLHLHWYKGNLLDQVDCSSNGAAETDRYVVVALFKSDVVCFDKKRGKSCVLLPRWPYRGFEEVHFINANEVVMEDFDEKVEFIVNIVDATVRKAGCTESDTTSKGAATETPKGQNSALRQNAEKQIEVGGKVVDSRTRQLVRALFAGKVTFAEIEADLEGWSEEQVLELISDVPLSDWVRTTLDWDCYPFDEHLSDIQFRQRRRKLTFDTPSNTDGKPVSWQGTYMNGILDVSARFCEPPSDGIWSCYDMQLFGQVVKGGNIAGRLIITTTYPSDDNGDAYTDECYFIISQYNRR